MAKIFISYKHTVQSEVLSLSENLHVLWDHEVWYDQKLKGGVKWWEKILEEIRNAEIFIFVLSSKSLDSKACCQELDYAIELGRPILPIRFSEEIDPEHLPSQLHELQYVDYWLEDLPTQNRLKCAIKDLPSAAPLPDPLPEPPPRPLSILGTIRERIDTKEKLDGPDQADLVSQIKDYLANHEANKHGHVRQILQKMRQRLDLLATTSTEIDKVLEQLVPSSPPPELNSKPARPSSKQSTPTSPPATEPKHRVERITQHDSVTDAVRKPQAVFTIDEAVATIKTAITRVIRYSEKWSLVLDKKNKVLISSLKEDGQPLTLHAEVIVRDNIMDNKSEALKKLDWNVGDGKTAAKEAGTAAVIYATSGLGAIALLSKSVRDYLLTKTIYKTWPSAGDSVTIELAAMELTACLKKICDPDTVMRFEKE